MLVMRVTRTFPGLKSKPENRNRSYSHRLIGMLARCRMLGNLSPLLVHVLPGRLFIKAYNAHDF